MAFQEHYIIIQVRVHILIMNFVQVWYHNGMSDSLDNYELCMRAESVELPAEGFFGVSAATGGLAGIIIQHLYRAMYLTSLVMQMHTSISQHTHVKTITKKIP